MEYVTDALPAVTVPDVVAVPMTVPPPSLTVNLTVPTPTLDGTRFAVRRTDAAPKVALAAGTVTVVAAAAVTLRSGVGVPCAVPLPFWQFASDVAVTMKAKVPPAVAGVVATVKVRVGGMPGADGMELLSNEPVAPGGRPETDRSTVHTDALPLKEALML
jgi:hypothetical protein